MGEHEEGETREKREEMLTPTSSFASLLAMERWSSVLRTSVSCPSPLNIR